MATQPRTRTTATLLVLLVAAGTLVPTATALAPDLTAAGVGSFLVDATGHAQGANVASGIQETTGTMSSFSVVGLGGGAGPTTVFDSIAIADFEQTRKIEGAGSAALTLAGSNAIVHAADASGGLLAIAASQATTVTYRLPSGVTAQHATGLAGHAGAALALTNSAGTELGTLVHIPAHASGAIAGAASATASPFVVTEGEVTAALDAGDRVLFRGMAGHLRSFDATTGISSISTEARHHSDTVVDLAARGSLVADTVSEFDLGGIHDVTMSHRDAVTLTSGLAGQNAIRSTVAGAGLAAVTASGAGAAVIQHELDYEVLPVQHASDVAVYVNGQLVPMADSAAQFSVRSAEGLAAAYALTSGGRTHVLSSLGAEAAASGSATVTIVDATDLAGAVPRSETQAVVAATSNVVGSFEALGDLAGIGTHAAGTTEAQTKFIGRFASGVITKQVDGATVIGHTDLETRTTVFDRVTVVGETLTGGERLHDAIVQVTGPATTLTAHDDLYGTTILHVDQLPAGRATQEVAFDLASGVHAEHINDQVVRLRGPGGYVGWLIVASGGANSPAASASSALTLDGMTQAGPADVAATLAAGQSLLLVAHEARTTYAAMDAIAHGISTGRIGGHALLGASGQDVTHLSADYLGSAAADLEVTRAARGAVSLTHQVGAATAATSFLVDARGTALMSANAHDLAVLVDGAPALQMANARAVLEAGFPAYFVDTSAAETLLVVVNAAAAARAPGGATVEILSDRAAAARADAAADLFGGFDVLADGTALGHYVHSRSDLSAGTLHDVTVTAPQGATVVFDAVRAGGSAFAAPAASGTAGLTLTSADSVVSITDQTAAVLRVAARTTQTTEFVLASGVRADVVNDHVVMLSGPNGFLGALVVADAAGRSVSGGSLDVFTRTGAGDATTAIASLEEGGQVVFRSFSGIETELDAAQRASLAGALAAGQVAGQVIVQAPAHAGGQLSERARFATAYASGATSATGSGLAVLHSATSFSSTMDVVAAATTNEVTVTLSSALEAGKTVLVSLDAGLVPGLSTGHADILFDGVPIEAASSYADVLAATDDAGVAEYHIITSSVSGASQVLVSVPHFSTHTVTIRSHEASGSDLFLWVSIGLALVVIGETAWMVYRRRTA